MTWKDAVESLDYGVFFIPKTTEKIDKVFTLDFHFP